MTHDLFHWFQLSWMRAAGPLAATVVAFAPSPARAGVPECNGLRLENALGCEVRGNVDCQGGCDDFGIYKKACATKLHTVCRQECTLAAEPTCTDECTEACTADCDAGVSVICAHNCFGECVGSCSASCEGADDRATCQASCEATCDGECDIQCRAVVDGSCYQHCIECCGGSCGAQANMDCQTSCQEEQFESCEYEFKADCSASCTGDGALFCDGEYVLSGPQMGPCFNALVARGIDAVELDVDVDVNVDRDGGALARGLCNVVPGAPTTGILMVVGLVMLGARRRRP